MSQKEEIGSSSRLGTPNPNCTAGLRQSKSLKRDLENFEFGTSDSQAHVPSGLGSGNPTQLPLPVIADPKHNRGRLKKYLRKAFKSMGHSESWVLV